MRAWPERVTAMSGGVAFGGLSVSSHTPPLAVTADGGSEAAHAAKLQSLNAGQALRRLLVMISLVSRKPTRRLACAWVSGFRRNLIPKLFRVPLSKHALITKGHSNGNAQKRARLRD